MCLFMLLGGLVMAGCTNGVDAPYNQQDFAQGGEDAPLYNERTSAFLQSDNQYSNIDSYKPKTDAEKNKTVTVGIHPVWKPDGKNTRVQWFVFRFCWGIPICVKCGCV